MANHGHHITMTTGPGAQNAKTILGVVKCYTFYEARQYLFCRSFLLPAHTNVRARGAPLNVSAERMENAVLPFRIEVSRSCRTSVASIACHEIVYQARRGIGVP